VPTPDTTSIAFPASSDNHHGIFVREPQRSAAELRAEIIAKLIEWGVGIVPDEGDVIEGETIAAPDQQSLDTGGVAIANGQSGDRRRSYSGHPRRQLYPDSLKVREKFLAFRGLMDSAGA
jgi:hypothetical protein